MKKQKKQKVNEERKEIKILRAVKESSVKEIKKEEKEEQNIQRVEHLEEFASFISREEERSEEQPVALLKEVPVENLEEELALVPRSSTPEDEGVKYGPASGLYGGEGGYGNLGYGNIQYEANQKYQTGMEPVRSSGVEEERGRQFIPGNIEAERVQKTTRSIQDRAMDYSSRVKLEEEKKKRRAEG